MTDETSSVQPSGVGTTWLYKRHGLLLGPLSYEKILAEIETGSITGDMEACQQGHTDAFRPVKDEPLFMVALAKAAALHKVEAQHRSEIHSRRKAIGIQGSILLFVTIAGAVGIAFLVHYLAANRPWERKVALPDPIIIDELPVISLSSRRSAAEDDGDDEGGVAYPMSHGADASSRPLASAERTDTSAGTGKKSALPSAGKKSPSAGSKTARPQRPSERDGLSSQQEWDEDAIQQIVAAKKKTLHPCLTDEAHRQSASNPNWSARIPLEFTVSNAGKVVKLWIDHHEFKDAETPLYKCMFKALSAWKFPAYQGEQANVSLSFSVQAR